MTERLIVKGFAGIENVELDIGRINILIGPQAAGKSVCAKLLYYFKSFLREIVSSVTNDETIKDFDERMLEKFKKYFPKASWPSSFFSIRYEKGNDFVQIERTGAQKRKLSLLYSDSFKNLFKEYYSIFQNKKNDFEGREGHLRMMVRVSCLREFLSIIRNESLDSIDFQQLFIPSGRSFFAYFQKNIFSLISDNQALDPFLIEFGSYYEGIKDGLMSVVDIHDDSIMQFDDLIQLILHGKYKREDKRDLLVHQDGRRVYLENTSSGQQEILPLVITLSHLYFVDLQKHGTTIYIEEPEAHLFPTAQRHIIELIATVFNTKSDKLQFVITTHSPYILTSFNNLMHAGALAKKLKGAKSKQLDKIVPEQYQLQPEFVKAYAIREGAQQNLISPESGLISADIIDEVSNELSVQFGDLLEVEENA